MNASAARPDGARSVAGVNPRRLRRLMREARQIVRFGFVGILATATFAGTSWLLVATGTVAVMPATVVAYLASAIVSYLGHLHFTFGVDPDHRRLISRFLIVATISFVVALAVTWLLTDVFVAPHFVSIVAVVVLLPLLNYFLNRFWVFSAGSQRGPAPEKSEP